MTRDVASATTSSNAALTYTLPSSTGALWLGLGASALASLAVTLLSAVVLMLSGAPLWLSVLAVAAGATVGAWPIGGRTSLQWLPVAAAHTASVATGHRGWTRPTTDDSRGEQTGPTHLRLPRDWGRLQLTDSDDPTVALLRNQARGTVTVVLELTATGRFGLLDPHAQDSELGRWGSCLALLLALPDLQHLQWLTHTRPQSRPPAPTPSSDRLAGDYEQLVAHAHSMALSHTHLLALTFSRERTADLSGSARDTLRQATTALLAADLLSCPLSRADLPRLLRLLLDPTLPEQRGNQAAGDRQDTDLTAAVLLSRRTSWSSCQTDDTHHRAYAVTGWPRVALRADWLAPLLHHPPAAGTARTLSVHARPVASSHAARRARAAAAKARLDAADRHRLGFSPALGGALDELDAEHTENELLAGYRMADLTALLTVHAPDPALLEDTARDLSAVALSQRIDLRALHGQHASALACTLPLGQLPGARP